MLDDLRLVSDLTSQSSFPLKDRVQRISTGPRSNILKNRPSYEAYICLVSKSNAVTLYP